MGSMTNKGGTAEDNLSSLFQGWEVFYFSEAGGMLDLRVHPTFVMNKVMYCTGTRLSEAGGSGVTSGASHARSRCTRTQSSCYISTFKGGYDK